MNVFEGATRKCPACGKRFSFVCTEDEWGYAYGNRLMCSYHCMRAWEKGLRGYKRPPIGMSTDDRSARDKRVCEMFRNGISKNQIAIELGIGHCTVSDVLRRNNLTCDGIRETRDALILAKRRAGMKLTEISAALGISYGTVAHVIQRSKKEATA